MTTTRQDLIDAVIESLKTGFQYEDFTVLDELLSKLGTDDLLAALPEGHALNTTTTKINFTRISNDTNGNPRYVCHFLNFIKDGDFKPGTYDMSPEEATQHHGIMSNTNYAYKIALKRAKQLGGRKFHNKQYGGGIVFQSHNIAATEKQIKELLTGAV